MGPVDELDAEVFPGCLWLALTGSLTGWTTALAARGPTDELDVEVCLGCLWLALSGAAPAALGGER